MNSASQNHPSLPFAAQAYRAAAAERDADVDAELRAELRALKGSIARITPARDVALQLQQLQKLVAELAPPPPKSRPVTALIERAGVEGRAAAQLRSAVARHLKAGRSLDDAWLEALREIVRVAPWPLARDARVVVALVGPSGVGKTTTSAKLAARALLAGRGVTLVACDGFRVGAVHQLSRYAELMATSFATASTPAELAAVVGGASSDVVIVDTAGLPLAADGVEASVAKAASGRAFHSLLCLPASVRAVDARRASELFAAACPTAVCVTKLDETDAPAGLLHGVAASGLPISVLCNGPRVPEDIAPATSAAVIDALNPSMFRSGEPSHRASARTGRNHP